MESEQQENRIEKKTQGLVKEGMRSTKNTETFSQQEHYSLQNSEIEYDIFSRDENMSLNRGKSQKSEDQIIVSASVSNKISLAKLKK